MTFVIIPATGLFRQLSPEDAFSGECRTRRHILGGIIRGVVKRPKTQSLGVAATRHDVDERLHRSGGIRPPLRARAGPPFRVSERLRWRRLWFGGDGPRQQIERTGGGADLIGGDSKISSRGAQTSMTKQQLNGPHIGSRFEQMDSKGVSKRMGSNRFGKCRQTMCFLARILNRGPGDRLPRKAPREQPFLRMRRPPVAAQDV